MTNSNFLFPAQAPLPWIYDINPATGNARATFNGEIVAPLLPVGSLQLTGDVTAGPGGSPLATTIAPNAVTTGKVAANAITTALIAAGNVTTASIAAFAITFGLIASGALATGVTFISNTASILITANSLWAGAVPTTTTFASSQTFDCSTFINTNVTLTGAWTVNAFTNKKQGQSGCIEIIQDGTGNRVVTWNANFVWAGGVKGVLSTAANARDLLFYQILSNGTVYCSLIKAVA